LLTQQAYVKWQPMFNSSAEQAIAYANIVMHVVGFVLNRCELVHCSLLVRKNYGKTNWQSLPKETNYIKWVHDPARNLAKLLADLP
jgi:hypothetical protein